MASNSHALLLADKHARRRRPTTACLSCRERRVRCGREKPTCASCKRGKRKCVYESIATSEVDFILEPQYKPPVAAPSADTWSDVLFQQAYSTYDQRGDRTEFAEKSIVGFDSRDESFTYLSSRGSVFGSLGQNAVNDFLERLPTADECFVILGTYIACVHPLLPICHLPSLRTILTTLHTAHVGELALENVILVCAVLYAGASSAASCHLSSLLGICENLWQQVNFFEYFTVLPCLQLLQGHLIYNIVKGGQLAPFAAFGFLPQTIRCAQLLGIHKDDYSSGIEQELGSRTWWHLVFLDVEASIADGLQSIIRPSTYKASQPNVTSGLTDSDEVYLPIYLAAQGQWILAGMIHQWFERQPRHDDILSFSKSIKALLSGLGTDTSVQTQWARCYLKLQIDRAYCMLGLRFWQLDQFRNTSCHGEVVKTAVSFLESYTQLLHLSAQIGFEWFIPGFLQPLHALVILLKHLSACDDREMERVRCQRLIETVVSARRSWITRRARSSLPSWSRSNTGGPVSLSPGNLNSNPRYGLLWSLTDEVWHRFGWSKTGFSSSSDIAFTAKNDLYLTEAHVANTTDGGSVSKLNNSANFLLPSFGGTGDSTQANWFFDVDNELAQNDSYAVDWSHFFLDLGE